MRATFQNETTETSVRQPRVLTEQSTGQANIKYSPLDKAGLKNSTEAVAMVANGQVAYKVYWSTTPVLAQCRKMCTEIWGDDVPMPTWNIPQASR